MFLYVGHPLVWFAISEPVIHYIGNERLYKLKACDGMPSLYSLYTKFYLFIIINESEIKLSLIHARPAEVGLGMPSGWSQG